MIGLCRNMGLRRVPRSAFRVPTWLALLALLPSAAGAVSLEADKTRTLEAEGVLPAAAKGDPAPLVPKLGDPGWQAREKAIDLVVIGSRGAGPVKRMLLGSTSEQVLREAPCSVLVVR